MADLLVIVGAVAFGLCVVLVAPATGSSVPMSADNIVGLVLVLLLGVYLVAADPARALLMTAAGWGQLIARGGSSSSPPRCSGATWRTVSRERRRARPGVRAGASGSSTGSAASTPAREQRWNVLRLCGARVQPSSRAFLYALQRLQSDLPFNPTDVAEGRPRWLRTPRSSFVTNTNWQSYYPETTMSHLTQMVGLTVQNFVSAAVGHGGRWWRSSAGCPARPAHDRELLGRLVRTTPRSCSRSRSSFASSSSAAAPSRTSTASTR